MSGFVHMEVICLQAYVNMYQGDELPEPKSMLQVDPIVNISQCHRSL